MMFYVEVFAKPDATSDSTRFTYDIEASTQQEAEAKARKMHEINYQYPIIESLTVLSTKG